MTALERLHRVRRLLAAAVLIAALAWAAALAMLAGAVGAALQQLAPSWAVGRLLAPVALALALITLGGLLWRWRGVRSLETVALWLEEREPGLQYALVTAVDPGVVTAGVPPALAEAASRAAIEHEAGMAARRLVFRALLGVLLGAALWLALPRIALVAAPGAGRAGGPVADAPNRLVPLAARVAPPGYARLKAAELEEPNSLEGLVGSTVTLGGHGASAGVTADLPGDTLVVGDSAGGGWRTQFRMPAAPGVLTLRDRGYRRLVVIAPHPDSVPEVVLERPAHDTTYQTPPSAPLALEARASDDLGLALGWFEYLISTGSGEHFTTVTRTSPRVALGPGRRGVLRASLALDHLELTPGSVVNIRAVVLDANDVSGPGRGVSETRTIRLAEPRDSVAVAPAPPDQLDSMLVSQRLLNLRTDTLLRERPRLTRSAVADRSMAYSNVQESIRLRVVAVVALLEDDGVGGTEPTEVSKLLRTAADEMQAARIELAISAPDSARPHMRRALAILDQVRNAHRYYLRGRTPPVLVDVERVRLQGKPEADPVARTARERLDDPARRLAERVERAARVYAFAPEAARDSLVFVRVAALTMRPDLATALGTAIDHLRAGAALEATLAPVRRLLAEAPGPLAGPPEWLGVAP